jgi:hypothetical protein
LATTSSLNLDRYKQLSLFGAQAAVDLSTSDGLIIEMPVHNKVLLERIRTIIIGPVNLQR